MNQIKRPSELFERALTSAGHLVADCYLCGRVHFATENPNVYEEGELEELRGKAKKEPDRYIEDAGYDTIAVGFLSGEEVVLGCPCNKLRTHEEFIWRNRAFIVRYLKSRIQVMQKQAQQEADLVEGLEA